VFYLKKVVVVAAAHRLDLNYPSKCQNVHGHAWKITIYCRRESLDENGMVFDFSKIKETVNVLDHHFINDYVEQPTAENIAKWLCDQIPYCYKVDVEESEGSVVTYDGNQS